MNFSEGLRSLKKKITDEVRRNLGPTTIPNRRELGRPEGVRPPAKIGRRKIETLHLPEHDVPYPEEQRESEEKPKDI